MANAKNMVGKIGLGLAIAGLVGVTTPFILRSGFRSPLWILATILFLVGSGGGLFLCIMGLFVTERKGYAIAGTVFGGMAVAFVAWMLGSWR